jgi:hypothetical protein
MLTARNRRRSRTLTRDQSPAVPPPKKPKRPRAQIDWRRTFYRTLIGLFLVIDVVLIVFVVKRCTESRTGIEKPAESRPRREEPEHVPQIEVLNGCGVTGLAARFTDHLRQAGFDVVKTDNYESHNVEKTLILDRKGNLKYANKVADALGLDRKRVLQEVSAAYLIDATVIIGRDFRTLGAWKNMEK